MAIQTQVELGSAPSGLRLKRKLGEKIAIHHKGEVLILQIISFSTGHQVTLGFDDPEKKFKIIRFELPFDGAK